MSVLTPTKPGFGPADLSVGRSSTYRELSFQTQIRVKESSKSAVKEGKQATQQVVRKAVRSVDDTINKHIRSTDSQKLTKSLQANIDPAQRGRKLDLRL